MPIETHRAQRGHAFYPSSRELEVIPPLYGTEHIPAEHKTVHVHYFTGGSDWWITELDPEIGLAFGYVRLNDDDPNAEWGYVDLGELEAVYRPAQVTNIG